MILLDLFSPVGYCEGTEHGQQMWGLIRISSMSKHFVPKAPGSTFSSSTRRVRRAQSYTGTTGRYLATLQNIVLALTGWCSPEKQPEGSAPSPWFTLFLACTHKATNTGAKRLPLPLSTAAADGEEASRWQKYLAALTFLNKLFSELCS